MSYKSSIILQLITIVIIKTCSETLFSEKLYHNETCQLICKAINQLVSIWCESLLKSISKQVVVNVFFKDMLIFKRPSNIDSQKIFCRLTLTFRSNSSKWKALYWVECYINFYVYFNPLSLLRSFLILVFKGVTKWYFTHYSSFVIILFKRVHVSLRFLTILLNTSFPYFCAFCVFGFESNVLNQDLKRMCYHQLIGFWLLRNFVLFIKTYQTILKNLKFTKKSVEQSQNKRV